MTPPFHTSVVARTELVRATLFHVKHPIWDRAARFLGVELDQRQTELLLRYHDWLVSEALPAGGIGPSETERIPMRHIADSLLFSHPFPEGTSRVVDLGSGVGLPGIPLAIVHPSIEFELVDRSGRRVDLMKRAVRVLDLCNVSVLRRDIDELEPRPGVLVSRATFTPSHMARVLSGLLGSDDVGIVGGSWKTKPVEAGWEVVEIPPDVLDQPVWLLIMRRR